MANETNIPPIIVPIQTKYDDKAMQKALKDIEKFGDIATKDVEGAKETFDKLKTTYDEMGKNLATDNKDIAKSMSQVEKAFKSAQKHIEAYNTTTSKLGHLESVKLIRADDLKLQEMKYEQFLKNLSEKDAEHAYGVQNGELVSRRKTKAGDIDRRTKWRAVTDSSALIKYQGYLNSIRKAEEAYNVASQNLVDANDKRSASFESYKNQIATAQAGIVNLANDQLGYNESARQASTAQEQTAKATEKLGKQFSNLDKVVRQLRVSSILSYVYALKRVWSFALSFVEASSSWIENLNLLEVTFADTTDEAKKFVDQMSEIFGFDKNVIAEYVAMFKQMANAMGQTAEAGTQMSKALTMIAIDISSLRNVKLDTAAKDLASAIAGQVKPVRKYGFDITMYSIDELMKEIGYGSLSRTMSQANKQLARTILLIRQSKDAWGDLGKTINTFANQQRILNDQWTTAKRLLGNYFLGVVEVGDSFEEAWQKAGLATKAIWTFNGALMYLNELLGKRYGDTSSFNAGVTSVATVADEATDSIADMEEEAQSALASFDKFNVLSQGTGEDSSATEALQSLLDSEYNKYLSVFSEQAKNVSMYAKDISDYIGDIVDKAGGIENLKDGFGGLLLLVISLTNPIAGILSLIAKASIEDQQMLTELVKGSADFFNIALQIGESFASIITDLMPFFKVLASAANFVSRLVAELRLGPPILAAILMTLTAIKTLNFISQIKKLSEAFAFLKSPTMIVLVAVSAVVLSVVDLIKNWDKLSDTAKALRLAIIAIGTSFALYFGVKALAGYGGSLKTLLTSWVTGLDKVKAKLVEVQTQQNGVGIGLASISSALAGLAVYVTGVVQFANSFEDLSDGAKAAGIAIAAILPVVGALLGFIKGGTAGALIGFGIGTTLAGTGLSLISSYASQGKSINFFADGGFQTGGLFYAGESGAEWVGRQGKTATIVNDKQMSDIMMAAVAKGVAIGNQSTSQKTTAQRTTQPIVVNVDGKKLFEVVEENGKRVGKKFTKVN